jgi:multisubunit Na+/H+ antiporter MnhB subunit
VSLIFIKFSAPDLALTQLSVEVVTVILLLLALYFLPQHTPVESSPRRRWRDAVLAVLAGGGVGALAWAVLTRPYTSIADYFLENSVPAAAAITWSTSSWSISGASTRLGEITVLALAGLAIYAMLEKLRLDGRGCDDAGRSLELGHASGHHGFADPFAAAAGAAGLGVHPAARPQPAGRRFHCRTDHRHGADHAISGQRRGLDACPTAVQHAPDHRRGLAIATLTGLASPGLRPSLPDLHLRPSALAAGRVISNWPRRWRSISASIWSWSAPPCRS